MITELIHTGIVDLDKKNRAGHVRHSRGLTASIITACPRYNWYSFKGIRLDKDYEPSPEALLRMRDGTREHDNLDDLLGLSPQIKVLDTEFGVDCQGIYARVDRLVEMFGVKYNLEFKTKKDALFYAYCMSGVKAFPGDYAQSQVILGSLPRRPLDFLVKCRGTSAIADEIVQPDLGFIDELVHTNSRFEKDLLKSEPPETRYSYGSPECEGCEYKSRCWFSFIRADTLEEKDLSSDEKVALDNLFKELRQVRGQYDRFVELDTMLRNYVVLLHTRHGVNRVRLTGVMSSLVHSTRRSVDQVTLAQILTPEQNLRVNKVSNSEFFRTTYNLGEVDANT